ncbi:MAG: hypothetical protein AAGB12_14715 [Pseudomonadota bacterium]
MKKILFAFITATTLPLAVYAQDDVNKAPVEQKMEQKKEKLEARKDAKKEKLEAREEAKKEKLEARKEAKKKEDI